MNVSGVVMGDEIVYNGLFPSCKDTNNFREWYCIQ